MYQFRCLLLLFAEEKPVEAEAVVAVSLKSSAERWAVPQLLVQIGRVDSR